MTRAERLRRAWEKEADHFDRQIAPLDRRLLAASRRWVTARARGATLEIAVGTGLNLPHYPPGLRLTGIDWSAEMVRHAGARAAASGLRVDLRQADATALPFEDHAFDAVVCTFSLCCIPDVRRTLTEAHRVLRPGGRLLLADHVASTNPLLRTLQHAADLVSVPLRGEHFTRRPLLTVRDLGYEVVETGRLSAGVIERVHARRP